MLGIRRKTPQFPSYKEKQNTEKLGFVCFVFANEGNKESQEK